MSLVGSAVADYQLSLIFGQLPVFGKFDRHRVPVDDALNVSPVFSLAGSKDDAELLQLAGAEIPYLQSMPTREGEKK